MRSYLVILPTYNELKNIEKIIPAIFKATQQVDILVVDDNSPDGTGQFVEKNYSAHPNVHVLHRKDKNGLGKAYLAGMDWALTKGYEFVVQMDADFSHRPIDLVKLIEHSKDYDLVIGSRWVTGGSVENWGLHRQWISKFGSFYARKILKKPVHDWTGGFNLWRSSQLKRIGLNQIESNGYSFQIEMKYKAVLNNLKYYEQPIKFVERLSGVSKMSNQIVLEAVIKVWKFKTNK